MRKKFWYIVHNLIAHPLLILGFKWTEQFHDWTADKLSVEFHLLRIKEIQANLRDRQISYCNWRDENYYRGANDLLYKKNSVADGIVLEEISAITDEDAKRLWELREAAIELIK